MARRNSKSNSTEMVTAGKMQLAVPTSMRERLAEFAHETETTERRSGGSKYISLKGGQFNFNGDVLPEPLRVIILDTVIDNAYYEGRYDPNTPASPVCFAIGRDEDELVPDPVSSAPQSETCNDCWANKFGSADIGKGKACRNGRRLAVVSADDLSKIDDTEPAILRIASTSVSHYSGYVKKLAKVAKVPPFAVITDFSIDSLDNGGFTVIPELVDGVSDESTLDKIITLRETVQDDLSAPYSVEVHEELVVNTKSKKQAPKQTSKQAPRKAVKQSEAPKQAPRKAVKQSEAPKATRTSRKKF